MRPLPKHTNHIVKNIDFGLIFFITLFVIFFTIYAYTIAGEVLSVPAQLVKEVSLPGMNNDFLRPSQVFIDNRSNEMFIIDTGNSRILIFDESGTFRFEFYGMDKFGLAYDVATDSDGYIYIIGSTKTGIKLFKFDYDGTYLSELALQDYNESMRFSSIEIDENENLILYNRDTKKIITFDKEGKLISQFVALDEIDQLVLRELVVYSITVKDNMIYIPVANVGNVYVYTLDGKFVRKFGNQGTSIGQLNFPVSVVVMDNNLVLVLDKLRFNVVCYNHKGQFLGEFGGKGYRAGWFYHPSYMAADRSNHVVVSQVYDNRVQICEVPQFILDKAAASLNSQQINEKSSENLITENKNYSSTQNNINNKYTTPPIRGTKQSIWRY